MRNPSLIGRVILHFETLESTQDVAIDYAKKGEPEGLVVVAEEQEKGRGRWGRSWFSLPSKSLTFSILLRPPFSPKFSPYLSLFPALSCAQAIEELGIVCGLKWPNDILIGNKKVGGVLVEMESRGEKIEWVVVGIGINVNLEEVDFQGELRETATSLCLTLGKQLDIQELLQDILKELNEKYYLCLSEEGRGKIRNMYEERDLLKGEILEVILGKGQTLKGVGEGIDERGFLRVRVGEDIIVFPAGDVHLLKRENPRKI